MRSFARRFGVLLGAAALMITALAVPASASSAPDIWIVRGGNLCINTATSGTGVAALVVTCNASSNDFWNINQLAGYQTIVNVNTNLCLTATSGAAVIQSACAGTSAQKWSVPNTTSTINLLIRNLGFGTCLVASNHVNDPVTTVTCDATNNRWSIVY